MQSTVVRPVTRTAAALAVVAAAGLMAGTVAQGEENVGKETKRAIERALGRMPYYGVFDFVAYGVDGKTVTLAGYAYRENFIDAASEAVKRVHGVENVVNKIELLPSLPEDDRIRWAAFYNVYTDEFLSKYAPGDAMGARYDAQLFARFPGMQPYGMYAIHVIVKNGRITLVGVVDSEADKNIAGIRAREVARTFGVENELVVVKR